MRFGPFGRHTISADLARGDLDVVVVDEAHVELHEVRLARGAGLFGSPAASIEINDASVRP